MNEVEEATRSNLVLLLSGFAHRGDRLWPGRFHETKATDGDGGTVRNRLTGLFPARKLCLGSNQKGSRRPQLFLQYKEKPHESSLCPHEGCVRALREGSSASDATEKKGETRNYKPGFFILPSNFWKPVLRWLFVFLKPHPCFPPAFTRPPRGKHELAQPSGNINTRLCQEF